MVKRIKEFYKNKIKIYLNWQNAMWGSLFLGIGTSFWLFYAIFAGIFWVNTYNNFKVIYPMMKMKYDKDD